jgi:hypothetical protein
VIVRTLLPDGRLEEDQIEDAIKHLTANFPSTSLIQNNRHLAGVFKQQIEEGEGADSRGD